MKKGGGEEKRGEERRELTEKNYDADIIKRLNKKKILTMGKNRKRVYKNGKKGKFKIEERLEFVNVNVIGREKE